MDYTTYRSLIEESESFFDDHELYVKYREYLSRFMKKQGIKQRGRTATTDSQRQKVYKSEGAWSYVLRDHDLRPIKGFDTFKEAEKYFKKVVRSKTYQKLVDQFKGRSEPTLRLKRDVSNSRSAGFAGWDGVIAICPRGGLDEHTILHELAHMCGNMHHDVGFRIALVKLVSRFMSPKHAKLLRESFRIHKLKMTMPNPNRSAKTPSEWLKGYQLMRVARSSKG